MKTPTFRELQIGLGLCHAFALAACSGPPFSSSTVYPTAGSSTPTSLSGGTLIVVGDLQKTTNAEQWLLVREQNDAARHTLTEELTARNAGAYAFLGDFVAEGGSWTAWREFDQLTESLRNLGRPIWATIGNHDYFGDRRAALFNIESRFPDLKASHYYSQIVTLGSKRLGLLFLDSNRSELGEVLWSEQARWYEAKIRDWESGTSGSGAADVFFVLCHHPPYTNSKVVGDDSDVAATFVPAYSASRKGAALISGHTHSYERIIKNGKTYLVSGGGGGPRVDLLTGSEQRHKDEINWPTPRPFHYLLFSEGGTGAFGIRLSVRGFDSGQAEVRLLEEVGL